MNLDDLEEGTITIGGKKYKVTEVEPAPEPVVVFGHGDLIRSKSLGIAITISHRGFYNHSLMKFVEWGNHSGYYPNHFTSECFKFIDNIIPKIGKLDD